MFSNYFDKIEKKLTKKPKTTKKTTAKGGKGSGAKSTKMTDASRYNELKEVLNNIIPSHLKLDSLSLADPSGYIPEGTDFIAYREYCRDIVNIMNGIIPCDLVHGTYHVVDKLDKNTLNDALKRVLQAKKINRYAETESEMPVIPAFIIAHDTAIKLPELKEFIIDHYMSKSIENIFELDILVILNKGIIVKDWREKRSFVAIETGKDTMMWFFILMNEYLEAERGVDFDLRFYVKHAEKYNEY